MFGLEIEPGLKYKIRFFVMQSINEYRLMEDMYKAEQMLKYLNSKKYKEEHTEHTPEFTDALVKKFTMLFKAILINKDEYLNGSFDSGILQDINDAD